MDQSFVNQTHNRYIAAVYFVTALLLSCQTAADYCIFQVNASDHYTATIKRRGANCGAQYCFNRLGYIFRQDMIGTPFPYCDKGDPACWPTPRLPIRGHNNRDATTSSWKRLAA
jgi:hypothetical protein